MNHLNQLIIEGYVKEKRIIPSGLEFVVSTSRVYKNADGEVEEEISYFDVDCYGNVADIMERKADIGRGIRIVGRLKQRRWKNEDGMEFAKVIVIAEHVEFKPKVKKEVPDEG